MDFNSHYSQIWGERWISLYAALLEPSDEKFARPNAFHAAHPELEAVYYMDEASLFPVQALQLKGTENVLDMCAAPGGKALILAEQVLPNSGKLTCNEYSRARYERLRKVFHDYIPAELLQKVRFTNYDASRWGLNEPDTYDAILLDAPCSGERHLLHDASKLAEWTPARSKQLAKRQYTLLCAALMSLKPGGRLVYSTCSISPLENDEVIARLLKKKAGKCKVLKQDWQTGEATEHGWQVLPDSAKNAGPLYWAALEKI